MSSEARIAEREAENAALREQVAALVVRVGELEGRLVKDSHNSSKPPSSDGLSRRKAKSLRQRSGKRPGGQLGHRGATLRLVATPDAVVEHRPAVCAGCQTPLPEEAPVMVRERRQVHDLPPVRLVVTEHQALHVRCPACQQISVGTFPAEAPSRAQYGPGVRALAVYLAQEQLVPLGRVQQVLADLFGVRLGRGSLVLQRHLRTRDLAGGGERGENLVPDTGAAPALVTAVDGLPGAKLLGERAPGGAGLDHPEHARQQRLVIARVAAQRGQERHNPLPLSITEFEAAARQHPLPLAPCPLPIWVLAGASGGMAALGNGLVLSAEQRPAQPERRERQGLGQR